MNLFIQQLSRICNVSDNVLVTWHICVSKIQYSSCFQDIYSLIEELRINPMVTNRCITINREKVYIVNTVLSDTSLLTFRIISLEKVTFKQTFKKLGMSEFERRNSTCKSQDWQRNILFKKLKYDLYGKIESEGRKIRLEW